MEKRVGRPIEKENRVKAGFSLDGKYNDMLNELSITLGKSKSRLVEEAILLLYDLEHKKLNLQNRKETDQENPFDSLRAMFKEKYS